MIKIIASDERYHADHGWLDTRWHFSFGDYYDPSNMHWGALRVFNDDIVQGGGGFDMHPHRDMEIITYMIDGELRHADSMGHTDVLKAGEVQVMSAGKGLLHSEANASPDKPLRLLQMWILPRSKGATPRWAQQPFTAEQRRNRLLPVVSDGSIPETLTIDQDASIHVASLDAGREVSYESRPGRHGYLFVISGAVTLNGQKLGNGDQARIQNETRLSIRADENAELILIDVV
jgi:redox-sensitive bicupin YhaK (pirin superfamily)